jgi:hypothetical protein
MFFRIIDVLIDLLRLKLDDVMLQSFLDFSIDVVKCGELESVACLLAVLRKNADIRNLLDT